MVGVESDFSPFFCLLIGLFGIAGKRTNLKEGDKAPDFALLSQDGNTVHLSDFDGKNVILYFYPKDDTPGYTKEACGFRDDVSLFKELKTEILGLSTDAVESHKQFQKKYGLNFTLLADPDKKVTKLYGVRTLLGLADRVTFVIDRDGIIRKVFPRVDVSRHSAELVEFVRQLESRSSSKWKT
jgi:peroxiredoxin Q/BCP